MKRKQLFISAMVLFLGGIIGSLINVLPIYGVVAETDPQTANTRLDRAEVIGDICVLAVVVGLLLFIIWTVLLVRSTTSQAHAHKSNK